jgi:hypothetical protein
MYDLTRIAHAWRRPSTWKPFFEAEALFRVKWNAMRAICQEKASFPGPVDHKYQLYRMGYAQAGNCCPSAPSPSTVTGESVLPNPAGGASGRTDRDRCSLDIAQGLGERLRQRETLGERDPDLAYAYAYLRAELQ